MVFEFFLKLIILNSYFNICFGDKEYVHNHGHLDKHLKDGMHDADFDHEAIMGSSDAVEDLKKLSPEEVKVKFLELLTRMDTNEDKNISKEEIAAWVLSYFRNEDAKEAEDHIEQQDGDGDDHVSWQEYLTEVYSYSTEEIDNFRLDTTPDMVSFLKMVDDDMKRFKLADIDHDDKLSLDEYSAFMHPQNYDYMQEFEIDQRLKEMDTDKDGQISFGEFTGEGVMDEEQRIVDQENFNHFDRDFNGQIDREELRPLVVPDQISMAEEEGHHLVSLTDANNDGKLSFEEILEKQDLWIGSSATAYGTGLGHDPSDL